MDAVFESTFFNVWKQNQKNLYNQNVNLTAAFLDGINMLPSPGVVAPSTTTSIDNWGAMWFQSPPPPVAEIAESDSESDVVHPEIDYDSDNEEFYTTEPAGFGTDSGGNTTSRPRKISAWRLEEQKYGGVQEPAFLAERYPLHRIEEGTIEYEKLQKLENMLAYVCKFARAHAGRPNYREG